MPAENPDPSPQAASETQPRPFNIDDALNQAIVATAKKIKSSSEQSGKGRLTDDESKRRAIAEIDGLFTRATEGAKKDRPGAIKRLIHLLVPEGEPGFEANKNAVRELIRSKEKPFPQETTQTTPQAEQVQQPEASNETSTQDTPEESTQTEPDLRLFDAAEGFVKARLLRSRSNPDFATLSPDEQQRQANEAATNALRDAIVGGVNRERFALADELAGISPGETLDYDDPRRETRQAFREELARLAGSTPDNQALALAKFEAMGGGESQAAQDEQAGSDDQQAETPAAAEDDEPELQTTTPLGNTGPQPAGSRLGTSLLGERLSDEQTEEERFLQHNPWAKPAVFLNVSAGKLYDFARRDEQDEEVLRKWSEAVVAAQVKEVYKDRPGEVPPEILKQYQDAAFELVRNRDTIPFNEALVQKGLDRVAQAQANEPNEADKSEQSEQRTKFRLNDVPRLAAVKLQTLFSGRGSKNSPEIKGRTRSAVYKALLVGIPALAMVRVAGQLPEMDDVAAQLGLDGLFESQGDGSASGGSVQGKEFNLQTGLQEAGTVPVPETPTPETSTPENTPPVPAIDLYTPKHSTWWDVAGDLLRDAKREGKIDQTDSAKYAQVIEALQADNPNGIDKNGINISAAQEAINALSLQETNASAEIGATTSLYEAQRGDTLTKITNELLAARGVQNPSDELKQDVLQSLLDSNKTYKDGQIDAGQVIDTQGSQDIITQALAPEVPQETSSASQSSEPLAAETAPELASETTTQPEVTQLPEELGNVALPEVPEAPQDQVERGRWDWLTRGSEIAPPQKPAFSAQPGENWDKILRESGVPSNLNKAVMVAAGASLVAAGYANKRGFGYVVGKKPLPPKLKNYLQAVSRQVSGKSRGLLGRLTRS